MCEGCEREGWAMEIRVVAVVWCEGLRGAAAAAALLRRRQARLGEVARVGRLYVRV